MLDLVFTESNKLDEEPFTTSLIISQYAEVEHRAIRQLANKYKEKLIEMGRITFEMQPLETNGGLQKIKNFKLNEIQATFIITLLKNTEPVVHFKAELAKQFYLMKQELIERQLQRKSGKVVRLSMTDEIKRAGFTKPYHYSNFTRLAYKSAIGFSSTEIKKARNIPKGGIIVDFLTADELQAVNEREQQIATLLSLGLDYRQIQKILDNQGVIYQTTLTIKKKEEMLC
ncbi:Rha family transcriptional regulator [Vagococcus elongatus]|uniref:Transcriptional regulator n=1 Tax=Vagococcus elongatus TaxID=180344 RepID=A0A430AU23_9ENTE|nr:Rha family transcriptional regulator [Vagococcus elongatus]RSU11553.1 transcriptional regulator [Vagococcus elongatus]